MWVWLRLLNPRLKKWKAYCVGTTVDQCLEAIALSDSLESAIAYDDTIMERFQDTFLNQD
jgi:hypothetical protein